MQNIWIKKKLKEYIAYNKYTWLYKQHQNNMQWSKIVSDEECQSQDNRQTTSNLILKLYAIFLFEQKQN